MENTIKIVVPAKIKMFCIPEIKKDICGIDYLVKKKIYIISQQVFVIEIKINTSYS